MAQITSFLKTRSPLLLIILLFILFKIPHLHYPFYWDESWSYAPGLQLMYQHGPSLMPDAIDTFYSRGHPLLFYAAMAAWMRAFGPGHFSMHCFSLAISLAMLVALFEVGKRLFNIRIAYVATVFLAIQVGFFVQASMCLPEVMVALLVLLSLYYYTTRYYVLLYMSLTALLFTKESGVVAGLILGIAACIELFDRNLPLRSRILKLVAIGLSAFSIVGFFLLQKKLNGWFFFPLHTGLIKLEFGVFWAKLMTCFECLFNDDKRYWIYRAVALAAVAGLIRKETRLLAVPLLLTILTLWGLLNNRLEFIQPKLMLAILCILFVAIVAGLMLTLRPKTGTDPGRTFIGLSGAFIILYLSFCCINFFTARYLLCLFPLLGLLIALFFEVLLAQWASRNLWFGVLILCIVTGIYAFERDCTWGDLHLQAYNAMDVQQATVDFLEQRQLYDKTIGAPSFQAKEHLTKPLTGMLRSNKVFKSARWEIDDRTEIAIFDNIEPDDRYTQVKADPAFYRIARIQNGEIWSEVFARKK